MANFFPLKYATRHGLIAGATGGGKTWTLASMAEHFTRAGVPVLAVDAKGDLEGAGAARLLDCYGERGEALNISLHDMGPDALARALQLSDAQAGALDVAYMLCESQRLNIHTLDDLQHALQAATGLQGFERLTMGTVTQTTASIVARAALKLKRAGAASIFNGSRYDVADILAPGLSVLQAVRLAETPALYSAIVLHILNQFYTRLPEQGDASKPRLAVFIDEAHLLFADAPPAVVQRLEQITRLIRSKGVALFYVTQSPADLPPVILSQLANRVQHALRGATQADLRAIRAAAETMPAAPGFDVAAAIPTLGTGEALCSFMNEAGAIMPAHRSRIPTPHTPPRALSEGERAAFMPAAPAATVAPVQGVAPRGALAGYWLGFALTWGAIIGGLYALLA